MITTDKVSYVWSDAPAIICACACDCHPGGACRRDPQLCGCGAACGPLWRGASQRTSYGRALIAQIRRERERPLSELEARYAWGDR